MNRISTHVLDISLGKPASGVAVRLEKQETQEPFAWCVLNLSRTDDDGRCAQLLPEGEELPAGFYRLSFDTVRYYGARKTDGLYPVIEITFQVREGESQFHIPLLLSPNGYSTYRGS
jgi:5-hydroxyisourate hydrolase